MQHALGGLSKNQEQKRGKYDPQTACSMLINAANMSKPRDHLEAQSSG